MKLYRKIRMYLAYRKALKAMQKSNLKKAA